MIRTIIKAKKNYLTISLPNEYVGQQLEVIAFMLEDESENPEKEKKQVTFDAVSLDTKGFKFNREEANER
jgi:translation initiation factor RLI1